MKNKRTAQLSCAVFLAIGFASSTEASTYNCEFSITCDGQEKCEPLAGSVQLFDRTPGQGRMSTALGNIDMQDVGHEGSKRRTWLIWANAGEYFGLATIYEDGTLAISDHSQQANGSPLFSSSYGTCEEVN